MSIIKKFQSIYCRHLSATSKLENIQNNVDLPECIFVNLHPSCENLYPPSTCLSNNQIKAHLNRKKSSRESSANVTPISISDEIDEIFDNSNDRLTYKELNKLSHKLYYHLKNWRPITEFEEKLAKKICPNINLTNVSVKQSPFEKNVLKKKSENSGKPVGSFSNLYETLDRQCALFSLQKDWCLSGVIGANDLIAINANSCDIPPTSIMSPEQKMFLWNHPWHQRDTYKNIQLVIEALEYYHKSDYFKLSNLYNDQPLFRNSRVIKLLVQQNTKSKKCEINENAVKKREMNTELENFQEERGSLIKSLMSEIPSISEWKEIDWKELSKNAPSKSQKQALDLIYITHLMMNVYLMDSRLLLAPYIPQLNEILKNYSQLYKLAPFSLQNLQMKLGANNQFTFNMCNNLPLQLTSISSPLSDSNNHSLTHILNKSHALFDSQNKLQYCNFEIDKIYILLRQELAAALTQYCTSHIEIYSQMQNFECLKRKFKTNKKFSNYLKLILFIKSIHIRQSAKTLKTSSEFPKFHIPSLLHPDAILTYVFSHSNTQSLSISEELYHDLYHSSKMSTNVKLQDQFYSNIKYYFAKVFPTVFNEYVDKICAQNSSLKSFKAKSINLSTKEVKMKKSKILTR